MEEKMPYELGATIRELRIRNQLTQKKLAKILGVTEASVSRYESNISTPPFETLRTLAVTFRVSMDTLCGLEHGGTLYLHGLTEEQEAVIRELADVFRAKNATVGKGDPDRQYALIGKITEKLSKK